MRRLEPKRSGPGHPRCGWIHVALALFPLLLRADSVTNPPVADTSLIEVAPDNNNGGQAWVLAGRTQNGPHDRGLYRFAFTNLPSHAIIQSVVLQLEVTRQPGDMSAVNSTFSLHRVFRPWGEGTNNATSNPGQGTPATPGGATWLHRFFPDVPWAAPGGEAGTDYSIAESAFQLIESPDLSPYRFESTPELVADVQDWVRQPESNFGWMLIGDEDVIFTARRFNSREDPNAQPALEVSFVVPPRVERVTAAGRQIQLTFTGQAGLDHRVEFRDAFTFGDWQTLTNVGLILAPTNISVTDSISSTQRFYRIEAH